MQLPNLVALAAVAWVRHTTNEEGDATENQRRASEARQISCVHCVRALRAQVTPEYRLGCKRVLISNDYYPALDRADVALVTDGDRARSPASAS